jgi:hypothetical protein
MGLADVLLDEESYSFIVTSTVSYPLSIQNLSTSFVHARLKTGGEIADQLSFEFVYEAFYLTCKKSSLCSYSFILFFVFSFFSLTFFLFKCCHSCQNVRHDIHRAFRTCFVKQRMAFPDEPIASNKKASKKKSKMSISNTSEFNACKKMLDVSFKLF